MHFLWDGLAGAFTLLCSGDLQVWDAVWRSISTSLAAVLLASSVGIPVGSLLARRSFFGRNTLVLVARAGMSLPTVLIGLLCYAVFSRRGPLGGMDLLYTQPGIVVGELALALPIIISWTYSSVRDLDPRIPETAKTLGASPLRRWWTYLSETRLDISLATLTAFARCFTELGVAMMIGGNIKMRTRTLTTATALETARGEFDRGVAMSLILLLIALCVTLLVASLNRTQGER